MNKWNKSMFNACISETAKLQIGKMYIGTRHSIIYTAFYY